MRQCGHDGSVLRLWVLVLSVAAAATLAGAVPGFAADSKPPRPSAEPLWRIYPLDPQAGDESGGRAESSDPVTTPTAPPPASVPSRRSPAGAQPPPPADDGRAADVLGPQVLGLAAAAILLGSILVLIRLKGAAMIAPARHAWAAARASGTRVGIGLQSVAAGMRDARNGTGDRATAVRERLSRGISVRIVDLGQGVRGRREVVAAGVQHRFGELRLGLPSWRELAWLNVRNRPDAAPMSSEGSSSRSPLHRLRGVFSRGAVPDPTEPLAEPSAERAEPRTRGVELATLLLERAAVLPQTEAEAPAAPVAETTADVPSPARSGTTVPSRLDVALDRARSAHLAVSLALVRAEDERATERATEYLAAAADDGEQGLERIGADAVGWVIVPGTLPRRARELFETAAGDPGSSWAASSFLSIGIAGFPRHARSPRNLFQIALRALDAARATPGGIVVARDEWVQEAAEDGGGEAARDSPWSPNDPSSVAGS